MVLLLLMVAFSDSLLPLIWLLELACGAVEVIFKLASVEVSIFTDPVQ